MKILLWGDQGTGKSTVGVKALNTLFKLDLPEIQSDRQSGEQLEEMPEAYILTTCLEPENANGYDMVISMETLRKLAENTAVKSEKNNLSKEEATELSKLQTDFTTRCKELGRAAIVMRDLDDRTSISVVGRSNEVCNLLGNGLGHILDDAPELEGAVHACMGKRMMMKGGPRGDLLKSMLDMMGR